MNTDDTGRYSAMYKPFHLIGLELAISVLAAALLNQPTGSTLSFNSDVVADFTLVEEGEITLVGFYMNVDLSDQNIQQKVNREAEVFLRSIKPEEKFNAFAVYFPTSEEKERGHIPTFFGIDMKLEGQRSDWQTFKIPSMLYAKFRYNGDLLHIGDLVVKDLVRWLRVAKIEMQETKISFIQAYDEEYKDNGRSSIYLPIQIIPQEM